MRSRFTFLQLSICLALGVLLWRLYYWQVIQSPTLRAVAINQYERTRLVSSPRGKIIFSDGSVIALNKEEHALFVIPQRIESSVPMLADSITRIAYAPAQETATDAAKVETDRANFRVKLIERMSDTDRKWVQLTGGLTKEQKLEIEQLGTDAFAFETQLKRYYPEGSMSAHLLGFVGKDKEGKEQGYFGIEGEYDDTLRGKEEKVARALDALGRPIVDGSTKEHLSLEVTNLQLSIQRDLQFLLEEKLKAGKEQYGAKSADGIILEPSTGKILAMASTPAYDPAFYAREEQSSFKNPTVADAYEPGSTFKVLTVASGIEAGVISPDTPCSDCGGPKRIGRYTIKTWNEQYAPNITMTQALVKSDNTAMMFVADKVGKDRFVSTIKNFGIGEKTGIDLQDERSPKLRERWGEIDLATASFGQGVAVTMIQMVSAVNAIANDGVLMKPMLVEKLFTDRGETVINPTTVRTVISKQTADTVTNMMIESASHGDAKWTLPAQYSIAGKTGTAQIPVDGHYDAERTIASFVGFAPADNPKFTMLIRVNEPTTSPWGSETAAPLWFKIAKELFVKFDVQPKKLE